MDKSQACPHHAGVASTLFTYSAQVARLIPLRKLNSNPMINAENLKDRSLSFLDTGGSLALEGLPNLGDRGSLSIRTADKPESYRSCQMEPRPDILGGFHWGGGGDWALTFAVCGLHATNSIKDARSSSTLHSGTSISLVLGADITGQDRLRMSNDSGLDLP